MEDFESPSLESSGLGSSMEAVREVSEKQRESYKKAQVQLQRAQKDEKKAKQDNDELFQILSRFIKNPYYEELVPHMTELLHISTPSRAIIALIALVYPDAALSLSESVGKRESIHLLQNIHIYRDVWEFRETDLDPSIREWMSFWIHALDAYIGDQRASVLMQKKLSHLLEEQSNIFEASIGKIVGFFFKSRNIHISEGTVGSYALFIKNNIKATLLKSLAEHPDREMADDLSSIDGQRLFGI